MCRLLGAQWLATGFVLMDGGFGKLMQRYSLKQQ